MSTNDPVMRAREPAKAETWGEFVWMLIALLFIALAVIAVLSLGRFP